MTFMMQLTDRPFKHSLKFYGSMPNSNGECVGATLYPETVCTGCRKSFSNGQVVIAELAPNMTGTFHHNDCNDPRLERDRG